MNTVVNDPLLQQQARSIPQNAI